jgi:quercetin dioxygenase-like cupin family protein
MLMNCEQEAGGLMAEKSVRHVPNGEGPSIWAVGDTYTFKSTGKETDGTLTIFEASVPPRAGPPPHIHHDADEAHYLLEGELQVQAGEHTFTAHAGSYVQIPRGTLHCFQNVGNRASRMLVILTPAGFEDFLFEVGRPAEPGKSAPPFGPQELERTIAAAPKYHLELRLPETA